MSNRSILKDIINLSKKVKLSKDNPVDKVKEAAEEMLANEPVPQARTDSQTNHERMLANKALRAEQRKKNGL